MFYKQSFISMVSFAAVLAVAPACAHPNAIDGSGGDVVPTSPIGIVVRNDNFLDVDVFAVADGMSRRLGTVTGLSSGSFTLDPAYASRDLRIVATPIGGFGRASTGNLAVSSGDTVEFTVGSRLGNSSVFVR